MIYFTAQCITTTNVSLSCQFTLVLFKTATVCVKTVLNRLYPRCASAAKDVGAKGQDLICYVGVHREFWCALINSTPQHAHKSILHLERRFTWVHMEYEYTCGHAHTRTDRLVQTIMQLIINLFQPYMSFFIYIPSSSCLTSFPLVNPFCFKLLRS